MYIFNLKEEKLSNIQRINSNSDKDNIKKKIAMIHNCTLQ